MSADDNVVAFACGPYLVSLKVIKYTTFLLCGIASLWPWNCFLSASDYFQDQLSGKPSLADIYSSSMMAISTLTSTLFNLFLSKRQKGVSYSYRLKMGNYLQMGVFTIMTLTALIPSKTLARWPVFYFLFVMVNVLLTSIGSSLTQVGMMALVNTQNSPLYANATVVGNAVAGVLPSVAMIMAVLSNNGGTNVDHPDRSAEAIKYFITSVLIAILAQLALFYMEHCERRLIYSPVGGIDCEVDGTTALDDTPDSFVGFAQLWTKLKYVESTIVITFSLTLVFPVFASTVESSMGIAKKVFVPLAFLVWNVGDLVGRLLCASPLFVIKRNKLLITYSIARLLFVPFFLMCNIKGRGGSIGDIGYLFIQLLFGITNGQLFSTSYMRVGELLETASEKKAAAAFTALLINLSLLTGSVASFLVVYLIS